MSVEGIASAAEAAVSPLRLRCVRVARALGAASAAIGLLVIIGWMAGSERLTRVLSGASTMKANTALGIVLLGLALLLPQPRRRTPARLLAAGALLIGMLTGAEWLFGVDLRIDQWLLRDTLQTMTDSLPGRMSPITAALLMLLGPALIATTRPGLVSARIGHTLAALAGIIALGSLVAYVYGVGPAFVFGRYTAQTAIHTATAFLLLSAGVQLSRPEVGVVCLATAETAAALFVRRLLPASFALPIILGWAFLHARLAGRIGSELAAAGFATTNALMFGLLVVWSARAVKREDTARRTAQDDLRRAHEESEQRVRDRTAELSIANTELRRQMEERERAEQAMRRSERHLRSLFDAANDAIITFDPRSHVLTWSRGAERIFGYAPEEIVGKPLLELSSVADRARASARMAHFADTEVAVGDLKGEIRMLRRDGTEFPAEISMSAVGERDERFFTLIVRDITDRHRVEQELWENTTLWRSILDSVNQSVISTDTVGIVREYNSTAERWLGYARGDTVGQPVPARLQLRSEIIARAKQLTEELGVPVAPGYEVFSAKPSRGMPDEHEWTYVRKDGTQFPVLLSVTALRDTSGTITGYVGIARDLTEQKAFEQELIRAKDTAETAMRARSDFLARMSHEIRTPMNGVIGMTELALQTSLTAEQRDYLETARDSAGGLLNIINDILDFSKIDAGKLRLENIGFNLRDCVGSAFRSLAHRGHAKGLELLLDVPPNVPEGVVGDPLRLQQIVLNLLGNAIKFTDRGEVELSVAVRSRTEESVELAVRVSDTGVGIPREKQRLIFDAFSQADEATTRQFGGTGLGLAITAQLADLMGGHIAVQSTPGKGSVFELTLPFRLAPDLDRLLEQSLPSLRDVTALIIDDRPRRRRVLAEMLRAWGMSPTEADAATYPQALRTARYRGTKFGIVLLDEQALGGDGKDLMRHLMAEPRGATPIILLANGDGQPPGAIAVAARLMKPVFASPLLEAIQATLSGTATRVSMAEPPTAPPQRRFRVLLAEDHVVNQKLVIALLTKAGHAVTAVDNGRAALEALAAGAYDLILMDMQMPEMDGFDAARRIREGGTGVPSTTPIIALTAQAMRGDRERCLEAGMDGYVAKPFRPPELFAEIDRVTRAIREEAPAPAPVVERPAETTRAPFDRDTLLHSLGGDEALLAEMCSLFTETAAPELQNITEALARADTKGVEQGAHKIRGALLLLCANPAAEAATALETSARQGMLNDGPAQLASLASELDRVVEAFGAVRRAG